MLNLAQELAARGFRIDLVVARARGQLLADVPKSVTFVDLGAVRILTSLWGLRNYMRRSRPVALLSVLHANIIAICAKMVAGTPTRIIVSERNTLKTLARNTPDLRFKVMPWLARCFYPKADGIVAVSAGVASDLAEATGISYKRIQVICNPVITGRLREKAQDRVGHPWFADNRMPVILSVGSLTAQKDFATLIQAFCFVRQNFQARLVILGEGDQRSALEALIKDLGIESDVDLPGFVPNPYPYMIRASVFVLSSRWEGLPGALIEALYCGKPVIATDCPSGPRDILGHGKYGKLVPVGSAGEMAQAIETALAGKLPPPPPQSWHPFLPEKIVNSYLRVLLGG